MRILKNKPFTQWAKKVRITDKLLAEAINEMAGVLIEVCANEKIDS